MGGESRRCFHATHPPGVKWNLLITCYQHPCAEGWKKFFFFFFPEINPDWWQHFLEHLQRCQTRFRRASQLLTLVLQQELLTLVLKKFSQIFKGFKVYPQILVWWNTWNHLVWIKLSPQQTAASSSSFLWGSCLNTAAQGPCLSLCPLRLLAGIRSALCLLMYWVWPNQSTMNPFTFCQVGSNHMGFGIWKWRVRNISHYCGKPRSQPFVSVKRVPATEDSCQQEGAFQPSTWSLISTSHSECWISSISGATLLSPPQNLVLFWDRVVTGQQDLREDEGLGWTQGCPCSVTFCSIGLLCTDLSC